MKICSGCVRTFALILLSSLFALLLFAFTPQASAQGHIVNQLDGRHGNAKSTHAKGLAPAASFKVLYSFCSAPACSDGMYPPAGLILDAAGNLYGTTSNGGIFDPTCYGAGCGMVFKIDNTGQYSVLYSFCPALLCADGANPYAGLILDSTGNLYGTTGRGGANGGGTVFKVDNTGHETVLYSFCSALLCADGTNPYAGLILDAAGNLYGTTYGGGAHAGGTVFKLDNTGHETVLYSFCSVVQNLACTDGQWPSAGLTQDAAGNLYGTTAGGGANYVVTGLGWGTVFKVDNTGLETVLYSFCSAANCTDGSVPMAGLIQDSAGNLYGTTEYGGANTSAHLGAGGGAVFKVDSTGHETVVYSFCSAANCTDGETPLAGLLQDAAGNLYGTTMNGGIAGTSCYVGNCGTVFKLDNTGQETVLYNFCTAVHCLDGEYPYSGLIQDAVYNLYGTTQGGGSNGSGAVFRLATRTSPGITLTSGANPSFVDQSVTFTAVISGSGLTPTGSVTFEEDNTSVGTVTLAGGQASLPITFPSKRTFLITANYSGDLNYNPVNSTILKQVVNQYTTSTALVSNLNPSTYGQTVTFTATVSSSGPTPTGTVLFKSGTTSLGRATLSGGVATLAKSNFAAGTSHITASYSGDTANISSTSPVLAQVVHKAATTTTIVSSMNPSKSGRTVRFTAEVTSPTTKVTGTVTFMDGSTVLGTGSLGGGKAVYDTSTLSVGSHHITAVYATTVDIGGSRSPVLVQVVN